MAYTDYCIYSAAGSNLNAGTRTGDTTVPGAAADFEYASGSWVAATGVFTVASGNPLTDGVAVGDFASVYANGSTVTGFVGLVTARDATTITVSLTAKSGTAPSNGTGNRTLRIGGAWAGPNAAVAFPFGGFVSANAVKAAGEKVRVNWRSVSNSANSVTATVTVNPTSNSIRIEGFTNTYGDGGSGRISGIDISGTSAILVSFTANDLEVVNLVGVSNGDVGSADMFDFTGNRSEFRNLRAESARGAGFRYATGTGILRECVADGCNISATATKGGFTLATSSGLVERCLSKNGGGVGYYIQLNGSCVIDSCIATTNASHGFHHTGTQVTLKQCDSYDNGGDGFFLTSAGTTNARVENSNAIKNDAYGFNFTAGSGTPAGSLINCGVGSGTAANALGATNGTGNVDVIGLVTYAADVTPWVNPPTDFSISLAAAIGAGRGLFGYNGANPEERGYPDIGASQYLPVAPDYPAVGDVESGVTYGSGAYTGTFVVPAVSKVKDGVMYGAGGTEFEGTVLLPAETDVLNKVEFGAEVFGGYEYAGDLILPDVDDVVAGVQYGASGTQYTGTFTCGGTPVSGGTLTHSPAEILAQMLIDLSLGTDPDDSAAWPVYSTGEPGTPDNCITTYDTSGLDDGSSMIDGEQYGHLGVQVRVRGATHGGGGWAKAHAISQSLDRNSHNRIVTVDGTQYIVYDVSRNGPTVLAAGKDSPTSRRSIYTINVVMAVRQTED